MPQEFRNLWDVLSSLAGQGQQAIFRGQEQKREQQATGRDLAQQSFLNQLRIAQQRRLEQNDAYGREQDLLGLQGKFSPNPFMAESAPTQAPPQKITAGYGTELANRFIRGEPAMSGNRVTYPNQKDLLNPAVLDSALSLNLFGNFSGVNPSLAPQPIFPQVNMGLPPRIAPQDEQWGQSAIDDWGTLDDNTKARILQVARSRGELQ